MQTSILNPYINFKNQAREAMEFYKTVFGGELVLHTFDEYHMAPTPETGGNIMHGMLTASNGMVLMGSDAMDGAPDAASGNMGISLSGDNEPELRGYYDKLLVGGTATVPIAKAPWGDIFGMLTDKFGVNWMVNITGPKA